MATSRRSTFLLPHWAVLPAAVLVIALFPSPGSAATSFSVRLEAGPHPAVTFDAAWHVAARRTVTIASPVTVSASARKAVGGTGTWLRITSGALAGRWTRRRPSRTSPASWASPASSRRGR